uniref:Enoyl reductase (ER) domain-containing protein n=1 Tax=Neobodo designis TaxID=312471 RepID=A0A7S1PPQ0_NEODS
MAAAPVVAKIVAEGAANSMKAWVLEEGGDLAKLAVKRVEIPTPAAGQLRVKVVTANTNPVDFKHASFGAVGAVFPAVFGCDGAGVVDAVGADVTAFKPGDRVHYFGNVFGAHGTYAEFAIADAHAVAPVPEGMDWATAGVVPCALWTAYEALFDRMHLRAGQTVFVAAGAGGVGHFAVQLAKHAGAKVITTASGDNVARLREQGYTVIDYRNEASLKDAILKATDGNGVDCALDCLGEEQAKDTIAAVAFGGQYTHIALTAPLPADAFFRGLTVHHVFTPGNVVRPDHGARFVAIAAKADALLVSGAVKPDVSQTYDFDGVKAALEAQVGGRVRGKQLIKISADSA